jgi:hypothetical protein
MLFFCNPKLSYISYRGTNLLAKEAASCLPNIPSYKAVKKKGAELIPSYIS